jgi:hypothetical protein
MKAIIVLPLLFSTITAINIACIYRTGLFFKPFGEQYTCIAKNVTSKEVKSLEEVTGAHMDGKSNADVKQIIFGHWSACDLDYVPQNIDKQFPNFIGLGFSIECVFKTLTGDELNDYHNLEWFFY